MAIGFERYGDEADKRRTEAIEQARHDILLSPLSDLPSIDTEPADPDSIQDWIENDPANFDPDEKVYLAGQAHGWFQVRAFMARERLDDSSWMGYVRDRVLDTAEDPADPFDPRRSLSDDQFGRLALTLALLQRGIEAGRSQALRDEDIENAPMPKTPEKHWQWLGGAAVVGAAVFGLVPPGAGEQAIIAGLAGAGAEFTRVYLVEKAYATQTRRVSRDKSAADQHNAVVAALEEARDKKSGRLSDLIRHAKAFSGRLELDDYEEICVEQSVADMVCLLGFDPYTPPKADEESKDKFSRKGAGKRIAQTAGMGFAVCALALGVQHMRDDDSAGVTPSSVLTPANTPPATAPRPLDRVDACAQITGDQDGDPRTPNTLVGGTQCPPRR